MSTSRRCRFAVVAVAALVALAACQTGAPRARRPQRVVLVSYDGLGADLAWSWLDQGVLSEPDGLRGMVGSGLAARRLRMVDPTLTSVNHISLATGLPPARTGIVGNTFHRLGTPITETVSGFAAPFSGVPLWTAARRAGRRVGVLLWPGADARGAERIADFGVVWPTRPLAPSGLVELAPEDAGSTGELPSHDGVAVLLWRVPVELAGSEPPRYELLVAAFDASPDGRPRYDTIALRRASESSWRYLAEREWAEVEVAASGPEDLRPGRYLTAFKPLHLDRYRGDVRLYRGATYRLLAYPDPFEDRLTEAVGPWPGLPDGRLVAAWWLDASKGIDLDTFLEQAERLDRYLDAVLGFALATENAELILAYHPTPDEYQHASLLVDPEQWAYSPGRAVAAREGLKRIGRSVDASVAAAWRALDAQRDALVVVSDHGLVPLVELARLNRALADAGLVRIDHDRHRLATDTPLTVVADAGVAHLYCNLVGRESTGVVAPEDANELLRRAAKVLADLSFEGRPVVERVLDREQAAAIGLGAPDAGDLVVFLAPGFAADPDLDGPVFAPSRLYGEHGYLSAHDAMCGVLFARGAGVRRARPAERRATDVAPMVASWLGLELSTGD